MNNTMEVLIAIILIGLFIYFLWKNRKKQSTQQKDGIDPFAYKTMECAFEMIDRERAFYERTHSVDLTKTKKSLSTVVDRLSLIYASVVVFNETTVPQSEFIFNVCNVLISENVIKKENWTSITFRFNERIKYFIERIEKEKKSSLDGPKAIISSVYMPFTKGNRRAFSAEGIEELMIIDYTIIKYFFHNAIYHDQMWWMRNEEVD